MNVNAKTGLLFVFFCSFCLLAESAEIPGGVAFAKGGNIVYYDFTTKEEVTITRGIEGPFNQDFAVSGDGRVFFFIQDNKIWIRKLPDGECFQLKMMRQMHNDRSSITTATTDTSKDIDVIVASDTKDLMVSYRGQQVSFGFTKADHVLIPVANGSPPDLQWKARWGQSNYPLLIDRPDTCHAVDFFDVETTCGRVMNALFYDSFSQGRYVPRVNCPTCGNTADVSSVWPYRSNPEHFTGNSMTPATPIVWKPPQAMVTGSFGLRWGVQETVQRFTIKRNAYFNCWSKDPELHEQSLAVIYQTPLGWGPIEIRKRPKDCGASRKDMAKNGQPGIYEIVMQLPDCSGLAWKPDGSLTCFSQGRIFVFKAEDIQKGIDASGLELPRGSDLFTAVNNVFAIQPEVAYADIRGSEHCWVSNSALLFRGEESLCLWQNGKTEVLPIPVSGKFCYCQHPPVESRVGFLRPRADLGRPIVASGTSVSERYLDESSTAIYIRLGGIEVIRDTIMKEGIVRLRPSSRYPGHEKLEYVLLTEEKEISDIKDPRQYSYLKAFMGRAGRAIGLNAKSGPTMIMFRLGKEVAVLKLKDASQESRLMSDDELLIFGGNQGAGTMFVSDRMTYEWKYGCAGVQPQQLSQGQSLNSRK